MEDSEEANAFQSRSTTSPFYYHHVPKNVLLILLSVLTLPISSTAVVLSLLYTKLLPAPRPIEPRNGSTGRKTILVTGMAMTKGLAIARLLSQHTPHCIIGADTSAFSQGRFSTSLSKFFKLTPPDGNDAEPYIDSLLDIMKKERVDLWISCSSVVAAVEDGMVVRLAEEAMGKQGFKAVQFREEVVEKLHEKDMFVDYVRELGLLVPESHRCTSAEEVLEVLSKEKHGNGHANGRGHGHGHSGRKSILKPIGVDDHARNNMMTLLPFHSAEETKSYVRGLNISSTNPFQLQQYIQGEEYCTHALIIRGRVTAFVACPSSELLMHYFALPSDSQLSQAMLAFTQRVAEDGGDDFTGHLSFDFLVPSATPISSEKESKHAQGREGGKDIIIYPIECNPRAHTAVALFSSTPSMASAYLSIFEPRSSLQDREIVTPQTPTYEYYWLGHDLVTLLILPFLDTLLGLASMDDVVQGWVELCEHIAGWRDGTFVIEDPLPFFVLYHVYWPARFLGSLWQGRRWSRVNVSTTKVFEG